VAKYLKSLRSKCRSLGDDQRTYRLFIGFTIGHWQSRSMARTGSSPPNLCFDELSGMWGRRCLSGQRLFLSAGISAWANASGVIVQRNGFQFDAVAHQSQKVLACNQAYAELFQVRIPELAVAKQVAMLLQP